MCQMSRDARSPVVGQLQSNSGGQAEGAMGAKVGRSGKLRLGVLLTRPAEVVIMQRRYADDADGTTGPEPR